MKGVVASFLLFFTLFLVCPNTSSAQQDTSLRKKADSSVSIQKDQTIKEDEEFNVFLISIAGFFICAIIGVAIAGTIIGLMILFGIFGLLSIGIISVSVVAGFYRRSFQYGFKSFVILVSTFAGTIIGAFGLLIIPRLLGYTISVEKALIVGALGGLVGGVILGLINYQALKQSAIYFWRKYHEERNKL